MIPVEVQRGDSPIILSVPHAGTHIPDEIFSQLSARGHKLTDTDWHVHRLYENLLPDMTMVRADFHRYVIDANRNPSGASLYPGQNTTGLVPLTDFDGRPIWNSEPREDEVAARLADWHEPYHAALEAELSRVRRRHGVAILYDCHSIRSDIPHLFDGRLPDFNIGTNGTASCSPQIERAVGHICQAASSYTYVINGRFKGGWTTRHYGQPEQNIHAIQMELAQSTYLTKEGPPFAYDEEKAQRLRVHLKHILKTLSGLAPELGGSS